MDIKQKLLLFLYENRHSSYHLEINHIFKDCGLKPIDIQALIGDLKRNHIIETLSKYALLGSNIPLPDKSRHYYTADNVELKAKLTSIVGEQYVRDNYLTQHSNPTITATQVIYTNGNITAPISQANDHSESNTSQSIAIPRKKRAIAIQIIKIVSIIIVTIAAIIAIYRFF